ncbi:MAG: cyclic pyranopterin monophosphate synthase MoaC [Clostridiales Family XIII bacterium]|nr:cyclic pyranopterin monophosphate synthase MoaC [Clostridiales Family XIII bacterium]
MGELNHIDAAGNAVMTDVSNKAVTRRRAVATGAIAMNRETFELILGGATTKGDVLAAARIAGIMAAKKTSQLIPLCHPLMIEQCVVDFIPDAENSVIEATCAVVTTGKTGAEMEALTGVATALLTVYDMCKATDRSMEIRKIVLLEKSGGKSGAYTRE